MLPIGVSTVIKMDIFNKNISKYCSKDIPLLVFCFFQIL